MTTTISNFIEETDVAARFWARVAADRDPERCWDWTGSRQRQGYGQMQIRRKNITAHRLSYELVTEWKA